jgi:hypothetical protein
MTNSKYDRGSSLENDVCNRLHRNCWAVVRAAGSGTTDRDSADVLAVNHNAILIIECKTYSELGKNIIEYDDYEQVMKVADDAGVPDTEGGDRRDVVSALVLRQKGSFSPRFVSPFPRTYHPDGDESLFKNLYQQYQDNE